MSEVRKMLDDVLTQIDAKEKLERHEVLSALKPAAKAAKDAGENVAELRYELIAAELMLYEKPTKWETYFGPWASGVTEDGQEVDTPPLEVITPECINYWCARIKTATHPAMRARYGDLVWDFMRKVSDTSPPIDAAHTAIDGYLEALVSGRCDKFHGYGDVQKRLLYLATSINDSGRLNNAVEKLQENASAPSDAEERESRQRMLFGQLMQIRGNLRPTGALDSLASSLRSRLAILDASQADQFAVENVALPLADYYRSLQDLKEAQAVLRVYGASVERMSGDAMPILAMAWLDKLHRLYLQFEMNEEAADVLRCIEAIQPSVPENLAKVSVPHEIDGEELEEWLGWLVSGDADASTLRLISQFVPRVEEAREQIAQLREEHPLVSLFPSNILDHAGRSVAHVGSSESDEDGNLVRHILQTIQFADFFLAAGIERLFASHGLTEETLAAEVLKSPIWHENRHPVLRRAIKAYFDEDPIVAVHLLVTEIENAIRNVAAGLGLSLQKRNRVGGFDVKNLSDFLAEENVGAFLGTDVTMYLRIVLTDRRGWNLRNDTCHGIRPASGFTQAVTRRLIHIVLLLSRIRLGSPENTDDAEKEDAVRETE